ncbi:hypothetical protein [Pediococcus pentosaceus]|uniref:hypothetical protein n=1 Tax=Pediococcus pentosaceus TaxID=1255 RepID=UPI00223B65F8|nr:hypothetical protein [Pediococcus pentosaceus]MCS8569848.1 hypothetical protein [Pediococcus pentosaceus]
MKKIILSAMLCGGMLLGVANSGVAHAADKLSGTTTATATVAKGDVTLDVDSTAKFANPQPLSADVKFDGASVGYTVTDYSGDTNGYTLSAKLTDTDATRTVMVGDTPLDPEGGATKVVTKDTDKTTNPEETLSLSVEYKGITEVKDYTTTIEWDLQKAQTQQFKE